MAESGYAGPVREFIQLADGNQLAQLIASGSGRGSTNTPEFESWRSGLQKLANDLRLASKDSSWILDLTIFCELEFLPRTHRADAVLVGLSNGDTPHVCVIEIKQWSSDSISPGKSPLHVCANTHLSTFKDTAHPLIQAREYAHSIQSAMQDCSTTSVAYLPNMNSNDIIHGVPAQIEIEHLILKENSSEVWNDLLSKLFITRQVEMEHLFSGVNLPFKGSADIHKEAASEDILQEAEDQANIEIGRAEIGFIQNSGHLIEGVGFYGSSEEFIELCDRNLIADRIMSNLGIEMRETTSEFRSWREGLYRLSVVLREYGKSLKIACEVPTQAGMVDALIGGLHTKDGSPFFLVVELKQWSSEGISLDEPTEWMLANGHICAQVGAGGLRETSHPVWQAERYVRGLRNYKTYFDDHPAKIHGVAFLPNHDDLTSHLHHAGYVLYEDRPCLFTGSNVGDFVEYLHSVFDGEPSDALQDMLCSAHGMTSYIVEQIHDLFEKGLSGQLNQALLVPSPEQQRAIDHISSGIAQSDSRTVHLIQAGPGTGKTIVGLYVLFSLAQSGTSMRYVAGNNPTPRNLIHRLKDVNSGRVSDLESLVLTVGKLKKRLPTLAGETGMDLLIVDEAQSLKWVGMAKPPSVKEMIGNSKNVVFLMDERQSMCAHDKVTRDHIRQATREAQDEIGESITINEHTLSIQQRAGRFTNLLPFLESILGFEDKQAPSLSGFDLHVHDTAREMQAAIIELNNQENVEAGTTASYCWEFITKKKDMEEAFDIILDGGDFQIRWNKQGGSGNDTWMTDPTRNERAGFPPEVQGQELHHVGLIIGPDVSVVEGKLEFSPEDHAYESPIFGSIKSDSGKTKAVAKDREKFVRLLRNQYWVLMTRGMRSLHIYSEDPEVRGFFSKYATLG